MSHKLTLFTFAVCVLLAMSTSLDAQTLKVVSVPWLGDPDQPHQVFDGGTLTLQGVVTEMVAGSTLTSATWDPGDGSGPQAVGFGNPRAIELAHTYNGVDGTPYVATVTVEDDMGNVASDTFRVVVRTISLDVEVNMAIDHGLWHLHKRQILSNVGGVDTGFWSSQNTAAATASSVLAMEVNNHLETGDLSEDPYVEDVARGLAHVMTELSAVGIGPQAAGDPDTNANTIGLQAAVGARPIYVGGQVIDSIVASGTPGAVAVTGDPTWVLGRTYADIVQDMMDQYYWGQTEAGAARGGWRYSWNSDADNSACQWMAIGGIAASRIFGTPVPQFVKDENLNFWLPFSQIFDGSNTGNDGRFGYTNTNPIDVNGMNTTPSGIVQLIIDDVLKTEPRFVAAERFMERNWATLINNNRIYGMFAVAKAMRLALPDPIELIDGTLDWYRADTGQGDPVNGVARHLVNTQQGNGSWDAAWVVDDMATSWGVVILSPTIFQLGPIADCDADPEVTGVNVDIEFDGTNSFHQDPARSIVLYEWDFDGDDIFDATGPVVTHSYAVEGTYIVKLQVTDDNSPVLTDTDTCEIMIVPPPIPPNADPNGPYEFCIGVNEPFLLDGTGSGDPDGMIVEWAWDYDPQPLDLDFDDAFGDTVDVTAFFTALGPGVYDVGLRVTDDDGLVNTDFTTIEVFAEGQCPPQPVDCPPTTVELWPPNHKYVEIDLFTAIGFGDPPDSIEITAITQDEPINAGGDGNTVCDGTGVGGSVAMIRAERAGFRNGRVYQIHYTASAGGGSCDGVLTVEVPHSRNGDPAIDDGQNYDSTDGCP